MAHTTAARADQQRLQDTELAHSLDVDSSLVIQVGLGSIGCAGLGAPSASALAAASESAVVEVEFTGASIADKITRWVAQNNDLNPWEAVQVGVNCHESLPRMTHPIQRV